MNSLNKIWDLNPAWGGPIEERQVVVLQRLSLWGSINYIAGLMYNATPTAWYYTPDTSRQATTKVTRKHEPAPDLAGDGNISWASSTTTSRTARANRTSVRRYRREATSGRRSAEPVCAGQLQIHGHEQDAD